LSCHEANAQIAPRVLQLLILSDRPGRKAPRFR